MKRALGFLLLCCLFLGYEGVVGAPVFLVGGEGGGGAGGGRWC